MSKIPEEKKRHAALQISEDIIMSHAGVFVEIPQEYHEAIKTMLVGAVNAGMGFAEGFTDGVNAVRSTKH